MWQSQWNRWEFIAAAAGNFTPVAFSCRSTQTAKTESRGVADRTAKFFFASQGKTAIFRLGETTESVRVPYPSKTAWAIA